MIIFIFAFSFVTVPLFVELFVNAAVSRSISDTSTAKIDSSDEWYIALTKG